jgi:hypothetical protein
MIIIEERAGKYFFKSDTAEAHIPTKVDGFGLLLEALYQRRGQPEELIKLSEEVIKLPISISPDVRHTEEELRNINLLFTSLINAKKTLKPFLLQCPCGQHAYLGGKDFVVVTPLMNKSNVYLAINIAHMDNFITGEEADQLEETMAQITLPESPTTEEIILNVIHGTELEIAPLA